MERKKNKNARTVSSSGVFFGGFPEFVPNRREEVAGNNPKFRLSARRARRAALPDRDVEARTLRRRLGSIFSEFQDRYGLVLRRQNRPDGRRAAPRRLTPTSDVARRRTHNNPGANPTFVIRDTGD